ncbi:hypothetical protein AMECASPLE_037396 [Ameca splendens]|uniref:Uncharacterized protein n=1 Tax=Ameca splendens TaxID=208324 RepID=A0ABV0YVM7_9TELE
MYYLSETNWHEVSVSLTNQPDGTNSLLTEMKKSKPNIFFNETLLQFWKSREAVHPKPAPVVLDLVSVPVSSLCGLLSSGLRSGGTTSLEQHVFLKVKKKLID